MHDDPYFTLTPQERDSFRAAGFDADAVEQLLRRMPPADRASKLRALIWVDDPSASDKERNGSPHPNISVLDQISNPAMQELLDKAWIPRWNRYSLDELERMDPTTPGVRGAIRQRRERRGE